MTSVGKEIVKQEKGLQPFARRGWWFTSSHHAAPSAQIVYKSTYTTQHISMKLGPNAQSLVLKFLLS